MINSDCPGSRKMRPLHLHSFLLMQLLFAEVTIGDLEKIWWPWPRSFLELLWLFWKRWNGIIDMWMAWGGVPYTRMYIWGISESSPECEIVQVECVAVNGTIGLRNLITWMELFFSYLQVGKLNYQVMWPISWKHMSILPFSRKLHQSTNTVL